VRVSDLTQGIESIARSPAIRVLLVRSGAQHRST